MQRAKDRVERDEEDLVRLYLTDIGRYPLLTKDDEVRLAQLIERGSEAEAALNAGGEPTPGHLRELRRTVKRGRDAERIFVQSNLRRTVVHIGQAASRHRLDIKPTSVRGNQGDSYHPGPGAGAAGR